MFWPRLVDKSTVLKSWNIFVCGAIFIQLEMHYPSSAGTYYVRPTFYKLPGPVSTSNKSSYHMISQGLVAARFVVQMCKSFRNLAGGRQQWCWYPCNSFKGIGQLQIRILWNREVANTFVRVLNWGPLVVTLLQIRTKFILN